MTRGTRTATTTATLRVTDIHLTEEQRARLTILARPWVQEGEWWSREKLSDPDDYAALIGQRIDGRWYWTAWGEVAPDGTEPDAVGVAPTLAEAQAAADAALARLLVLA